MRKSPVTLRIAEPCAQSWADMTPQGAGRHCAACQKVVIDFTQKTDAEILAVLAAATGQTCGRFGASQLDRALQLPLAPRAAWWQTAVAATVALLGFRTLVPSAAQAQAPVSQLPAYGTQAAGAGLPFQAKPAEVERLSGEGGLDIVLTGRVVDKESGKGISQVVVMLKGTNHGVTTDEQGHFSLPVTAQERHLTLVVFSIGYNRVEMPQPKHPSGMKVQLVPDAQVLGGLGVINSGPSSWLFNDIWQRLRAIPAQLTQPFQGNQA
ncbi:carboxypeptidase-like regulatory domain-containing protein [Hymenobacter lucidus]|uniref:Carboxypeptidase-like regulatory domain-containing protein n=1 Tax=Hymenobacter lucidus TaxID=2880930 RepID=A0ABS8AKZ8_9BACT|nr:carboxypeptidase-like regulatory domain-containing protein [Hymenobacter lucidus]MCB2406414.1 carboxypeptidase-like regulatory domain-containing protein [Hymenobacter lucidus]